MGEKYKIIRFYRERDRNHRVIKKNLTLEQAQAHCEDPETSSSTATKSVNRRRTRLLGAWFDGYDSM